LEPRTGAVNRSPARTVAPYRPGYPASPRLPSGPAVDLDELRPLIEQRVRELHRAFEASPEDCWAALVAA